MAESVQQVGKLPPSLPLSAALWAGKTTLEKDRKLSSSHSRWEHSETMECWMKNGVCAARAESGAVNNTCDQAAEGTRKMHVRVRAFCN